MALNSSLLKVSRDVSLADALSCGLGLSPLLTLDRGDGGGRRKRGGKASPERLVIKRQQAPKLRHVDLLEDIQVW